MPAIQTLGPLSRVDRRLQYDTVLLTLNWFDLTDTPTTRVDICRVARNTSWTSRRVPAHLRNRTACTKRAIAIQSGSVGMSVRPCLLDKGLKFLTPTIYMKIKLCHPKGDAKYRYTVGKLTTIEELILAADKKSFRQMSNTRHCLLPLLHSHRNRKIKNHWGTAVITTFYHISRPISSKTVFKIYVYFHTLVYFILSYTVYVIYSNFNILAFIYSSLFTINGSTEKSDMQLNYITKI